MLPIHCLMKSLVRLSGEQSNYRSVWDLLPTAPHVRNTKIRLCSTTETHARAECVHRMIKMSEDPVWDAPLVLVLEWRQFECIFRQHYDCGGQPMPKLVSLLPAVVLSKFFQIFEFGCIRRSSFSEYSNSNECIRGTWFVEYSNPTDYIRKMNFLNLHIPMKNIRTPVRMGDSGASIILPRQIWHLFTGPKEMKAWLAWAAPETKNIKSGCRWMAISPPTALSLGPIVEPPNLKSWKAPYVRITSLVTLKSLHFAKWRTSLEGKRTLIDNRQQCVFADITSCGGNKMARQSQRSIGVVISRKRTCCFLLFTFFAIQIAFNGTFRSSSWQWEKSRNIVHWSGTRQGWIDRLLAPLQ